MRLHVVKPGRLFSWFCRNSNTAANALFPGDEARSARRLPLAHISRAFGATV
jgi:hypothetical protein